VGNTLATLGFFVLYFQVMQRSLPQAWVLPPTPPDRWLELRTIPVGGRAASAKSLAARRSADPRRCPRAGGRPCANTTTTKESPS
jgi:hypothetical protein